MPTKGGDISHRGAGFVCLSLQGVIWATNSALVPCPQMACGNPKGVTAAIQPPGGSSKHHDVQAWVGDEQSWAGRAYGAGQREVAVLKEATWGGHYLICGEITKSMTEHDMAPLHGHFQSVLSLTQVNPKAGFGERSKAVTCW